MMSQRPGGSEAPTVTPPAPSVGNYKGVMLCNRPAGGGGLEGGPSAWGGEGRAGRKSGVAER
jgi:hypothetical protein